MTDNSTHLEFTINKNTLNDIILDELVKFSSEKLQSQNYDITFSAFNLFSLSRAHEKGHFTCVLEAGIEFNKSAGIFSIQASGTLDMHVTIGFSVSRQLELNIQTKLDRYNWKTDPVLHMGALDISLETLSDCAILHFSERFLNRLDERIVASVNIVSIIDELIRTQCTNHLLMSDPELFANICPVQIQLFELRENQDHFIFDFFVELAIRLTSEPLLLNNSCKPSFFWLENKPEVSHQTIEAEISTTFLTRIINQEINGIELGGKKFVFENTNIILKGEKVQVKSSLVSPLQGNISVEFVPLVDSERQHITLQDIKIQISPENILYKITAPIIETVLEQWIQSKCPWDIQPYFTNLRERLPVLSLADNSFKILTDFSTGKITSFTMKKEHINCSLLFVNPSVHFTT